MPVIRLGDVLDADRPAGPGAAVEDHRLAELRRQGLDEKPRRQVLRPARGEGADQAHRAVGPRRRLAQGGCGERGEGNDAEAAAGQGHGMPPSGLFRPTGVA